MASTDMSPQTLLELFLQLDADRSHTISRIVDGMKFLNKTEREIRDVVDGIEKLEIDLPTFMGLMGMASIHQDANSTFKEKISQFQAGVVVWHPALGYGIIVDVVPNNEHGKPFVVRLVSIESTLVFRMSLRAWGSLVKAFLRF